MGTVAIRCYGELNDFLPFPRRQRAFSHAFTVAGSVKDTLESLGVPHPEIDLVLVNGEPAGFDRLLAPGDRVAAYPRFRRLDVAAISPVHVPLPTEPRFLLDGHLGRLARHLRLLGFDTAHQAQADDAALAATAAAEDRILLTRDLDLLKRAVVRRGYRVRRTSPEEQLAEVVRQFDLAGRSAPSPAACPAGSAWWPPPPTKRPGRRPAWPPATRSTAVARRAGASTGGDPTTAASPPWSPGCSPAPSPTERAASRRRRP